MNFFVIEYTSVKAIAELCKGSTADSDSVCLGSNPSSAAKEKRPSFDGLFSFFWQQYCGFSHSFLPLARIGFAFERKTSGSWLTSGEAKNLPSENDGIPWFR